MKKILLMGLSALLLVACIIPEGKARVGFEFGTTVVEARGIASRGINDLTDIPVVGTGGTLIGTITLSTVEMLISEIDIDLTDAAEDTLLGESDIEGPFLVDLLTGKTNPEIKPTIVDAKAYEEIEFEVEPLDDDEKNQNVVAEDHPLYTHSIRMRGVYKADGQEETQDFEFLTSEEFEFEILDDENGTSLVIPEGQEISLSVIFQAQQWFNFTDQDFDFSSLPSSQAIVLSDDETEDDEKKIKESIEKNIEKSGELEDDDDDDYDD